MRAVLLVAFCATLVAGFDLFPAGGTRVWSGELSTKFSESDPPECFSKPETFPMTLTVNNETLRWSIPAFSNGTFSYARTTQLDKVKSHNAAAGQMVITRLSSPDIYISYAISAVHYADGAPLNNLLQFRFCYGADATGYPGETDNAEVCGQDKWCFEANLFDAEWAGYYPGAPPPFDRYCQTYCNRVLSACYGDNALLFPDYRTCMAACQQFPSGAAPEPDLTPTGTAGYNSRQCRTYQAGLAFDNPDVACPRAGPLSTFCTASHCERLCYFAKSPLYEETCTGVTDGPPKPFADFDECVEQCMDWTILPEPVTQASFGKNSFQCRAAVVGAMMMPPNPDAAAAQDTLNIAYCSAFLPEGGALCAGVDYTANFTGVYQQVTGHCNPRGTCCCSAGPSNVTLGVLPFPNNIRMVAPVTGTLCADMKEMDIPIFVITSPTKAVAKIKMDGIPLTMELRLSNDANEVHLYNVYLDKCPSYACKDKNKPCTKDKIVFSAAPSTAAGSLVLAAAVSVAVALANLLA